MSEAGSEALVRVAGYLVVRVPEQNADPYAPEWRPELDGIWYAGAQRLDWWDVSGPYYEGTAPDEIAALWRELYRTSRDATGLEVTQDLAVAERLQAFANRIVRVNEVIAVHSPTLAEIKGTFEVPGEHLNWLGYDPILLGEWSLLQEGVFREPHLFSDWRGRLNPHGLFDEPAWVAEYAAAYAELAQDGLVERPAGELAKTEAVAVWRYGPGRLHQP